MTGWIYQIEFCDKKQLVSYIITNNIIYTQHISMNVGLNKYQNQLIFKNKGDIHELLGYDYLLWQYYDSQDNRYKLYINKININEYKIINDLKLDNFNTFKIEKIKFPIIHPLEDSVFIYPKERVYI